MKDITITTTVYTFEELSDEAKEKALEFYRDFNTAYWEWWETTLDDQKEQLEKAGINKPAIEFSGFWSQGDGLSFTSKDVNLETLMESSKAAEKYPEFYKELQLGNIDYSCYIPRTSHHYSHARTAAFSLDTVYPTVDDEQDYDDLQDIIDRDLQGIIDYLDDWRMDKCHEFYRALENEFNYLTADEALIESFEANEMEFTADGKAF